MHPPNMIIEHEVILELWVHVVHQCPSFALCSWKVSRSACSSPVSVIYLPIRCGIFWEGEKKMEFSLEGCLSLAQKAKRLKTLCFPLLHFQVWWSWTSAEQFVRFSPSQNFPHVKKQATSDFEKNSLVFNCELWYQVKKTINDFYEPLWSIPVIKSGFWDLTFWNFRLVTFPIKYQCHFFFRRRWIYEFSRNVWQIFFSDLVPMNQT